MRNSTVRLLATDPQRSVLIRPPIATAFTPFGYASTERGFAGYDGLHCELQGFYLLGNGHRAYSPMLLRFSRPDELSPFGAGGINGYAYCGGDPVNRHDPSGQFPLLLSKLADFIDSVRLRAARRLERLSGRRVTLNQIAYVTPQRPSPTLTQTPIPRARAVGAAHTATPSPSLVPASTRSVPSTPHTGSGLRTNGRIEPALPLPNLHQAPRVRPYRALSETPVQSSPPRSRSPSSSDFSYDSDDSYEVELIDGVRRVRLGGGD